MLIIISGSSGSGKNTILTELIKKYPKIKYMLSCTTRKRRFEGENNYIYLTEDEFIKKINNDEFFEYEEVHEGIFYGVLKKSLQIAGKSGFYINDVDVHGAVKIKNELKNKAKLIYLDVPKEELIDRLRSRGESEESIFKRLSRYEHENSYKKYYDLVIQNKNIDDTIYAIENFLKLKK